RLRPDGSVPELDVLLVRPHVIHEAKPRRGTADESAALRPDHIDHALHDARFQENVVVDELRQWRSRLLEKELPLLGEAAPREVAMDDDVVTVPAQRAYRGLHLDRPDDGFIRAL